MSAPQSQVGWTAHVDWSTLEIARSELDRTNAFVDANDAEDRGLPLMDPSTDDPANTTFPAEL